MNPFEPYAIMAEKVLKERHADFGKRLSRWRRLLKKESIGSNPITAALKLRKEGNLDEESSLWLIVAVSRMMSAQKRSSSQGVKVKAVARSQSASVRSCRD